ncbi:LacI family DNA-binding transcriptional regulator [Mammaliicoccus lentus]|uniref:LacI family DNA-binding transcriptional regulator n=1 Tax=Mammaliicoccus lentus TaxID=42858 RepID=UPI001071CBA1|nr:LacI family DNA-binding transcriptional regulator [Mammaliicoccus lentus]MBF0748812.1 LacI family DNA-binding transcriptional regulator [Mammaliicoccus lentus]TFU58417.1 LacI family transcriptional regulator [Mammaliicoccus lentus]WQL56085.1 LacI family DNA-binding transcriptional regulator [Mammaliicoccus lentus]
MNKISIYDVAKLANVSQSTVSRVLNNYPYIKPETKQKVLNAIKELGFSPNEIARGLANNKTNTIGLIIENISNSFYSETAHIILREARKYNYEVIIIDSESDKENFKKSIDSLMAKRVDGIIVASTRMTNDIIVNLIDKNFPIITYNRRIYKDSYNSHVVLDNFLGANMAIEHLVKLNHKRIAYISGPLRYSTFYDRLQGFLSSINTYNLEVDEEIMYMDKLEYKKVYDFAKKLMNSNNPPTAYFSSTDNMALAVMEAAVSEGLKIPEDISVIGCDDIDISGNSFIQLTTIAQQKERMATLTIEKLMKKISDKSNEEKVDIVIKPQLKLRKTTAEARKEVT